MRAKAKSGPTEKERKENVDENDCDGANLLYKNDDKLCACTADIVIDVCLLKIIVVVIDDVDSMSMSILMGWTTPTFLNATTAAIEVRAQMLL